MNFITKALVSFSAVFLLTQIPFAYNRYRTARLASEITRQELSRTESPSTGYKDYKGVIHVHSFAGGHSTGTYFELIDAAEKNSLDFVVMTEHVTHLFDSASKSLNSRLGETLWVGGNEVSTSDGDRFLIIDGSKDLSSLRQKSTREFLSEIKDRGKLALLVYPGHKWPAGADGAEVFSLHTSAKQMNAFFFLMDALWSYGSYPELTLARHFRRPDGNLEAFDRNARQRPIHLFGGNDAHSNIGLFLGDNANNRFFDLKYDRYETIFSMLRTHVLIPAGDELDQETLIEALRKGNSFMGLDVLGDSSGFSFLAKSGDAVAIMGEEFDLANGDPELEVFTPLKATVAVFRDGEKVAQETGVNRMSYKPAAAGVYRTEVYLDSLGAPFDEMPWIISNPIWVRRTP